METCSRESVDIAGCRRFPIRIVLSEYAADLACNEDLSLAGYITKLLNSRTEQTLTQRDVLLFLESYPFLLVLDGLDEVPPSSNRTHLIDAINDFEADVAVRGMDAMIVVTTRPQGYSDDLSPRFYRHQVLTPLRPEVALQYGKKLTRLRYGMDPEREARINERLELAAAHEATSRLMQSPLQVTIMTALVDQFGRPPEERWDLFNRYYELICSREIERNIQNSQLIRDHEANIDKTHRLYGLLLQSENERTGGTRSRLPLEKFENVVQFILEEELFTGDRLQEVLTAIRTAAANRLVFLSGLEEGQVGFEIRSLQEFMAGEALLDGTDQEVQLRLEAIGGSSNWRNVLLFITGKIFKKIRHMRPHIISICNVLNDNPSDPARQILMSGSQLALDILADGAARKSPRFARQLTHLALRLLSSPIHATGRSLADVCTQDTLDIYTEELDRLLNSANKATCRESWVCFTRLVDLGFAPVDAWFKYIGNRPQLVEDPDFYWMAASAVDTNTAVLTELASRLYSMPADSLIRALIGSRKPEVLNMSDLLLQTIEGALDVTSRGHARPVFVRIADWGDTEVGFNSCRPYGKPARMMLDDRCHASWRVVDAAAAYSSVGTAEALATLVETAKEVEAADSEPQFAHPVIYANLPWPALACLRSASLNNSHDAIAQALRTGAMGSLEEWQKWEDSWITDGLNWDSVPARHGALPFIKDHWLGAPAIATYSISYSAKVLTAAWQATESAVSIATQLNDPAGRQAVVSIPNLFWQSREAYPEIQKVPLSVDHLALVRKVFDIVGGAAASSLVAISSEGDASTASVEEFARLVNDFFATETHFDFVIFDDNAIDLFRLAVARDPSLTGLLAPLAMRAANPDLSFAPFDVATHRKRIPAPLTPRDEFSLLLIGVRQGGLRLEELASVVRLIEQLPHSYLEGFFRALGASAPSVDAEAVLVELYRELQRSVNGQALMVIVLEELSAMARGRMTRLSTGAGWERLGLPRRIIEICTTAVSPQ